LKKSEREILLKEFENWLCDNTTVWATEFMGINGRRFRFDYVIHPNTDRIAVEINGGQWINGRHNRGGKAYENDLEKSNLAQANGWLYLQFTYEMLARGDHFKILDKVLLGK